MLSRILFLGTALLGTTAMWAETVNAKSQAKINHYIELAKAVAADPEIEKAVAAQNAELPAACADITEEKWSALTNSDPFVRSFTKNAAAKVLREKLPAEVTEAFLSDNRGVKVAFLGKTTSWCHKGKPKHDQPMAGQVWQGKLELDKSSGTMEVQIAVPVLQAGSPVGSLVIGVSLEAFTMD